jgi:membrane protein
MRLASLSTHLPVRELVRRTYAETMDDDGLGLAAQLAYYFFLALVPALLFLLALASFVPVTRLPELMPTALDRVAAPEVVALVRGQLQQILSSNSGGILSLGLIGALWSSSAALVSLVGVLNRAYDLDEHRPWWKIRLLAIGLTIGLAVFVIVAFALVLAGPALVDTLAAKVGMSTAAALALKILQWPVAFALVCVAIGLLYYFAPDAEQEWVWVTPGALIAATGWLIASSLFRIYAVSFGNYQATYGALGGVVVLLLWMYITGLILIVGAEVNAEIEHASPWAREPAPTRPGERKKIGVVAERAFRARSQQQPGTIPRSRSLVPTTFAPPPAVAITSDGSAADYALAFLLRLVWPRARRHRVR